MTEASRVQARCICATTCTFGWQRCVFNSIYRCCGLLIRHPPNYLPTKWLRYHWGTANGYSRHRVHIQYEQKSNHKNIIFTNYRLNCSGQCSYYKLYKGSFDQNIQFRSLLSFISLWTKVNNNNYNYNVLFGCDFTIINHLCVQVISCVTWNIIKQTNALVCFCSERCKYILSLCLKKENFPILTATTIL